jgi:hypothetical protein
LGIPERNWEEIPIVTVIYYTSNREDPRFEGKIRENLLKVIGDLPVISVSQKPISFGHNYCVGDHGTSGFNMFRQVQVALEMATTPFVISAEADCLYPPDYFTTIPGVEDVCYRDQNLYVMGYKRDFFYAKQGATHAQIIHREFYLNRLNELFAGAPDWSTAEKNFPLERHKRIDIFHPGEIVYYKTVNPVVQFKTGHSMRRHTSSSNQEIYDLPYWGNGKDLRKEYLWN